MKKRKIDVTILCVYNKKDTLEKQLLSSLQMQNVEVELVLIDNCTHTYSSAAKALNYGASQATSKYILFVHQDIVFKNEDAVNQIYEFLKQNPKAVIGAAGIRIGEKGVISHIVHGVKQIPAGDRDINVATRVDVLDECMMGLEKDIFEEYPFDECTCDGWDLYVVDVCLHSILKQRSIFVLPLDIWHVSPGNPKHAFYRCARRLYKKYRHRVKRIQTCCITIPVPTSMLSFPILYALEWLHAIRR